MDPYKERPPKLWRQYTVGKKRHYLSREN
jgi:hypothetical protein